jgi:hypothetical protein
VTDRNRPLRQPTGWHADLLADDIARLDSVARVLAGRVLHDPRDVELAAVLASIDRVIADLVLIAQEIEAPTIETRSRRWGDAA